MTDETNTGDETITGDGKANELKGNDGSDHAEVNLAKCPCALSDTTSYKVKCCICSQEWHQACVGLKFLDRPDIIRLTEWNCPYCYQFPENAIRNANETNLLEQIAVSLALPVCDDDKPVTRKELKEEFNELYGRLNAEGPVLKNSGDLKSCSTIRNMMKDELNLIVNVSVLCV